MAHLAWVILGFQAVWFSCAWGVAHAMPVLPISVAIIYLAVFFLFQKIGNKPFFSWLKHAYSAWLSIQY